MASIIFTSSASVREHHRHGAVDWRIVWRMAPGMLTGSLLSTLASGWISQRALALSFTVIVYGGATQILLGRNARHFSDTDDVSVRALREVERIPPVQQPECGLQQVVAICAPADDVEE